MLPALGMVRAPGAACVAVRAPSLARMLHYAMQAPEGRLLFREWEEAHYLWHSLAARVSVGVLMLMPNHVHLLVPRDDQVEAMRRAMRAFARWRNARRGERGRVWDWGHKPKRVLGGSYRKRTLHYVFLNPCRRGLVDDPLAWPFSSYRDALGLALPALHRAWPGAQELHQRVCRYGALERAEIRLPRAQARERRPTLGQLAAAVSALTRTPLAEVREPGPARALFIHASRELANASSTSLGSFLGVGPSTVRMAWRQATSGVDLVARVLGDARFTALAAGDLRRRPTWGFYRHHT